jgi:tetratricopeptide (TPR) repeat protein
LLASQLMGMRHEQEAMEIWQQLIDHDPDDSDAQANLGSLLLNQKKYQEAADHFESSLRARPDQPYVEAQLGFAYLGANQDDMAMARFSESIKSKADPLTLNNIAYALAERGAHLSEAQRWAEQAVEAKETESATISTDALSQSDLGCMTFLAAYWDTLGWVYFKEGNLVEAGRYLEAAWNLAQNADQGEHLGRLYERQGKTAAAAHQLALAKALGGSGIQGPPPLRHRDGSVAAAKLESVTPLEELSNMRRLKLGRLYPKSGSAEFWLLFALGPKLQQIKFISGNEEIRPLESALQSAKFNVLFPDDHPTRIVRRGVLVCEGEDLGCDFTLYTPDMVTSTE